MTEQEWNRKMEFIFEQQARFSVHIDQMREEHVRLREADDRLRESQGTLTAGLLRIAELVEELGERQKRTDEQLRRTDEQGRMTDERLNILMSVVEKPIAGGNGQKPSA